MVLLSPINHICNDIFFFKVIFVSVIFGNNLFLLLTFLLFYFCLLIVISILAGVNASILKPNDHALEENNDLHLEIADPEHEVVNLSSQVLTDFVPSTKVGSVSVDYRWWLDELLPTVRESG